MSKRIYLMTKLILAIVLYAASSSAFFKIPDTGQTTCYNLNGSEISCSGTGQDGAYNIYPLSYKDNGNGTVSDNNTGLMWQKTTDGKGYNWYEASGSSDFITSYYNPKSINVCGNLVLGGHSDWRLPSIRELLTITNYSKPLNGTFYGPAFSTGNLGFLWSSTHVVFDGMSAWGISGTGEITWMSTPSTYPVLCVRGQSLSQTLVDNNDGTVSDTATGLMWQSVNEGSGTWEEAITLCENSPRSGYKDWRLPNVRELLSLVDYSKSSPSIDTAFFPATIDSNNWTSWSSTTYGSTYWGSPKDSWLVGFSSGYASYYSNPKSEINSVRCVRSGKYGPGILSGHIQNKAGAELANAVVTIGPFSTVTNQNGSYNISNIPLGNYKITVSKVGYTSITQSITLNSGKTAIRNFQLSPTEASSIKVLDVSTKYDGFLYYLTGTDFSVTYTANISWGNHQPGIVRFITSKGLYDIPTTSTTASKTLNIATEFEPCTTLRVVAIAADGKMSAEKSADFTVMSPFLGGLSFGAIDIGDGFYYDTSLSMNLLSSGIPAGTVPGNIPVFGGKALTLNIAPTLHAKADSSGKVKISLEMDITKSVEKKTKASIAGMELSIAPKVDIQGEYNHPGCDYRWSGGFGLNGSAGAKYTFPFMAGPVPMYWATSVNLNADAMLDVTSFNPFTLNGNLEINPSVKGSLGVGHDEMISVEGWLGGGADMLLQYPQMPTVKDASLYINAGASAYALGHEIWSDEAMRWDWNIAAKSAKAALMAVPGVTYPRLVSRNYLSTTGTFGKQPTKTLLKSVMASGQSYTVATTPLQSSIYPYSDPRLSSAGTSMSLTWLADNATRSAINRTQALFSSYGGGAWSTPQPIADDGTADFSPVALTFSDGTVIAAWEDEKIVIPDTATFSDMMQNLEISTAVFDPATNTWKPYQRITDNAYLDRSPKLAGKNKDNVMLVWIANKTNDIRGGSTATNKIWYSTFNGTAWSTPQLVAQAPFGIVKYSLAYDGNRARLVMSLDIDGDSSTVTDHELYLLSYDSNTWSGLTRMTDDTAAPVADDNPQVAIDPDGDFVLTWLRGNEISSVINFNMADRTVIRADNDYSSNLADFKLIYAPDGKMALMWAEPSTNSSDIFTAVYDPIYDFWGAPKQLTFDAETEKNISAAFLGSETLVAVYNRMLMGQAPSATDLYMLTNTMGNDLALQGGSLVAIPPNPEPGDSVTFTVVVQNLGDTTLETIPVAFYHGDPANGGIKISEAIITGPFKPGDTQNVSIIWTIPLTTTPLTIYAVIDPTASIDPVNRSNNVATLTLGMADLAIYSMSWTKLTDNLVSVTARAINRGAISSLATTIKFRQDSLSGTLLNVQTLPSLAIGEARDFNFVWDVTGLTNQQYMVFATVDEENVLSEFDETNNAGSETIPVNLTNVMATLNIQTTGTGSGSVSSTPPGLACNTTCSGQFPWGATITLKAVAAPYSIFTGWASPFTGNDDCTVSMTGTNGITAMFDYDSARKARIYDTTPMYYSTITDALGHASPGDLIEAWAQPFRESITVTKHLKFKGGYDDGYLSNGGLSILYGTLTIMSGSLTVERLVIE